MVLEAVGRAETVLLSNIPPRDDNKQFRNIAENIEGVEYINHDTNFRYQDGNIDSSTLMLDQLHLLSKGIKKLIENLSLTEQTKSTTGNGHMVQRVNNDTVGRTAQKTWSFFLAKSISTSIYFQSIMENIWTTKLQNTDMDKQAFTTSVPWN